jgi:hypothetical protein
LRALEEALTDPRKRIFLVTQRDPKVDEPGRGDLYDMGRRRQGHPETSSSPTATSR